MPHVDFKKTYLSLLHQLKQLKRLYDKQRYVLFEYQSVAFHTHHKELQTITIAANTVHHLKQTITLAQEL
jgi:hypothetical protein